MLDQYLRLIIHPILLDLGIDASAHDNPIPDAPTCCWPAVAKTSDLPTILIYGHGDVIHGQDAQWDEGLSPFEAVIRNGMSSPPGELNMPTRGWDKSGLDVHIL